MAEKVKKHYCARFSPVLQEPEKKTFPMFKKVVELDENGDNFEKFIEMTEDEKKDLRASSPYVDCGIMKETSPIPRDIFEVFDEMQSIQDSVSEEEWEGFKNEYLSKK